MRHQFEFADVLERWPLFLGGAWLTIPVRARAKVTWTVGRWIGMRC